MVQPGAPGEPQRPSVLGLADEATIPAATVDRDARSELAGPDLATLADGRALDGAAAPARGIDVLGAAEQRESAADERRPSAAELPQSAARWRRVCQAGSAVGGAARAHALALATPSRAPQAGFGRQSRSNGKGWLVRVPGQ